MKKAIAISSLILIAGLASADENRAFGSWTDSNALTVFDTQVYGQSYPVTVGTFPISTEIVVDPYVYVNGNTDARVTVTGYGSASSDDNTLFVVNTNLDLTFNLRGFGAISQSANSNTVHPSGNELTIAYDLQSENGSGTFIGTPSSTVTVNLLGHIVSPFSGATFPLASSSNGAGKLKLHRHVEMTGLLPGDATYTSTGNLDVIAN